MRIAGLYAITDPDLLPAARLFDAVQAAVEGGAAIIQYRNKQADAKSRLQQAERLGAICRAGGALFIVNDDVALAEASGAHGVHLGQRDGAINDARRVLGADAVIGQTCHASIPLALAAEAAGADYVAFGRFFPSRTKPEAPPADLALLPAARSTLSIPIVAIGGITAGNAHLAIRAGADAIAVIHDLFSAGDVAARARELAGLFNQGHIE